MHWTLLLSPFYLLGSTTSLAPKQIRLSHECTNKRSRGSYVDSMERILNRRSCLAKSFNSLMGAFMASEILTSRAYAGAEDDFFDDPEIKELYENPAIPPAPEERSGLVVLRVAEVAQFQEKILRSIVSGELQGVQVSPMQFQFGTQILLRNSNLAPNMKLMISQEIPWRKRSAAQKNAAEAMNTLQSISSYAGSIQRDFEKNEMVELADMYLKLRINLNQLYEYLPTKEKDKYYGYFMAVTEYEKKVAEGTYNPDIDGILKFEK